MFPSQAMALTRRLVLARADKAYICLHCQLRAFSSSSRLRPNQYPTPSCAPLYTHPNTHVSASITPPLPFSRNQLHVSDYSTSRPPSPGRRASWSDRLRKKLWENGEGPDPRAFKIPGETPEEQDERIRLDAEEKASKEREEKDFEALRKAGEQDRLDRFNESVETRALELRKGFTVVNDQDELLVGEDGVSSSQEQKSQLVDYKPATRWRGLRYIPDWQVKQEPPKPLFTGFLARDKTEDSSLIERAVLRAIVEIWVLNQAGEGLELPKHISNPTDDFDDRLAIGAAFDRKDHSLRFTDDALLEDVKRSLGLIQAEEAEAELQEAQFDRVDEESIQGYPEEGKPPPRAAPKPETPDSVTGENAEEENTMDFTEDVIALDEPQQNTEGIENKVVARPPLDQNYRHVSLSESAVKFAVLKRVMQLTGTRIADPVIPHLKTAGELVRHMATPPSAKRLFDNLAESKEIGKLSNVEIREKRYMGKDKEVEIGRWKLIEAELTKRGLPLDRLARPDHGSIGRVRLKNLRFRKLKPEGKKNLDREAPPDSKQEQGRLQG